MGADRTLSLASECLPTQLTSRFWCFKLFPSKGHSGFYWSTNRAVVRNGDICHIRAAVCLLGLAWDLTRGFSLPMSKLHRGALGGVPQSHSAMCGNSEGAGLWLLSHVCQSGGGAVRGLHAEVLRGPEVLPDLRGRLTFAAAHLWFRSMWTKGGIRCHNKSGPPGSNKW